jgi:ribosome modulation factor
MGRPYRDGERAYLNGYNKNPYSYATDRSEWQRGYDDAQSHSRNKMAAEQERRNSLWSVPDRAKDAYMAMEDDFSASTVLDFMLAMHPEKDDD